MAPSSPEFDADDRLHHIVRAVHQEALSRLNPRPSYRARRVEARKVNRVSRGLNKSTIESSPSSSEPPSEHGDLVNAPSDSSYSDLKQPALKKRNRASRPPSHSRRVSTRSTQSTAIPLSFPCPSDNEGENLPVRVTLASGLDPVSLADISTVAKIRSMVSTEFAADLAAFASPEELKVLAYRFKVSGEDEWTAITTAQELREELKRLKEVDLETKIVRMQICLVEGDEEGVGNRPLLLGKAAAKKLKAAGEQAARTVSDHASVQVQESHGETMDEDSMVTISRKEYDSLQQTKRDLKDTLGFLARSLEIMAGMPSAATTDGGADAVGEQNDAGENVNEEGDATTVAEEDDKEDDGVDEAVRRVTHATRMLAERTGFRFE